MVHMTAFAGKPGQVATAAGVRAGLTSGDSKTLGLARSLLR